MSALAGLLENLRGEAAERVWGAAVQFARAGGVVGVSDDGEEVHLTVKTPARPVPYEVWLWPDDPDWDCSCGKGGACVHVVAAAIALNRDRDQGMALPEPAREFKASLRYDFSVDGQKLAVVRSVVRPDGSVKPLRQPLKTAPLIVGRADVQAESLLTLEAPGGLSADSLRKLLAILGTEAQATLDGQPVRLDPTPIDFRVKVRDQEEGFRVGLYRPDGIDAIFRGAVLRDGAVQPTSHGQLKPDQRRMLIRGVHYGPDEVAALVSEAIPSLRRRIPVDIETARLPKADALVPRVRVHLKERPEGLEVKGEIVYGDPPVAAVGRGNVLRRLSKDVVPARDRAAERTAQRDFEERFGRPVGFTHLLSPAEAVVFLDEQLPRHGGPVEGRVSKDRFRIVEADVTPHLAVHREEDRWRLDVSFGEGELEADPFAVLQAWRSNRTLVPLLDGGWAPLPGDWLKRHGHLLQELLDARDGRGRVDRNATAALVELLEDTEAEVPADLSRLRRFLAGEEGLPEVELPDGFTAELRPYQRAGLQWLGFLRELELSGILADDMGLGKTVMALAALAATPGPHLVVAPTSVLRNWENEAHRFAPKLRVDVYHGPGRAIREDADLILTSYTLLRMDLELLREIDWGYVVLDEAQAIKNARSQTARAACKVGGNHRLCLTGTPVENRLEELWSLFRFLMPGLLGPEKTFREQFARPIEEGSEKARLRLRSRIRPYVLRRMKSQVAAELPPLTQVVIRCTLPPEQREVYEGVRIAARAEVRKALAERGRGATLEVLEALLRMRQACCDPSLLPGTEGTLPAAKLDRLEEILVELIAEDHKALVFSQWTSLLDRVEPRLEALGIDWVRLDGTTRDRQAVIDAFQDPLGPPVFLLSLKAGGTGLNLTEADYVVHLDPWWNPAVEQQATDRAHRIGQDRPVMSCKLVAEDTVEERILELQDAKRGLADAALGTEGGFVRSLSSDELRALFEGGP